MNGSPDPFSPDNRLIDPDPPGNVTTEIDTGADVITGTVRNLSSFLIVEQVPETKTWWILILVVAVGTFLGWWIMRRKR